MTVEELRDLLQKLIDEGKGDYILRSAEFEYRTVDEEWFGEDDETKTFWL